MQEYSLQPSRQLAGKPTLQTSQQRPWETAPRRLKGRERLHSGVFCGGRKMPALLPDQGAQPGKKAEKGAELPHAPSAPAAVERAEPPDQAADVKSPPPSAAEPSDPWHSPAYRPRGSCLAEAFCHGLCSGGPRNADGQAT
ncbi:hypothetical protein CRENBAI_021387 [Crenichthys baileyi]|uniref:Uncharacterized protein n=1 Tax=Crenichthys baileyi TaxID=28760 RepID=A0AAV9SIH9_9TELE